MNVKVIYNDIDENKQARLRETNLNIIFIEEEDENSIRFLTKNGAGDDLVIYAQDFRSIVVNYESKMSTNKALMKEIERILGKNNIIHETELRPLKEQWFSN